MRFPHGRTPSVGFVLAPCPRIAEAGNDPGFGLKLGKEERVERYDPVKIIAISARSFRDAIERISRQWYYVLALVG
jgi:Arabinose-binding domain of AraC transcription regulator, N-term